MANEIDQKVISQLLDFNRSVETLTGIVEKSIDSTDNLVGSQDRFGKKMDAFTEVINGPIQKVNQSVSKPPTNNILGAFQEGGIAKDKGKYLVGENGPELVDLPKGSAVIPLNIKDFIEGISKIPELSDIAKGNEIGLYADSNDPSLLPLEISDVKNRVSLSKLEEKYNLDLKDQESLDRDKQNKELIDQLKGQSDLLKELKSIAQKKISDSIEEVRSGKESIASFDKPGKNKSPEIEESIINAPIEQKTDLKSIENNPILKSAEQIIPKSPSKSEIENITKSQEKFLSKELGLLREFKPKEYERIKEIAENNLKGGVTVLKLESDKDEVIQNKNYKDIISGKISTAEIIKKIGELPSGSLINKTPEFQRDVASLMPKTIISEIQNPPGDRKFKDPLYENVSKVLNNPDIGELIKELDSPKNTELSKATSTLIPVNEASSIINPPQNSLIDTLNGPNTTDVKLIRNIENLISPSNISKGSIKKIGDLKNDESAELTAGSKKTSESELISVAENLISPSVELFYKNQKETESAKGENILGAFRTGGIADKGGKYLVGENGPEMVSSPLSTTPISSNTQELSKLVSNTEVLPASNVINPVPTIPQSTIQNNTATYTPTPPVVNKTTSTNLAKNISNIIGGGNPIPTVSAKDITQQVTSPVEVIKSISNIISGTQISPDNPLPSGNISQPNFISGTIDLNSSGANTLNSADNLAGSQAIAQSAEMSNSLKKINEPIVPGFKQSITPLNGIKTKEVPSVNESLDKFKDGLSDIFKQNQSADKNTAVQPTAQPGEIKQGDKSTAIQPGDSTSTNQDNASKNLNENLNDVKSLLARIAMLLEGPLEVSTIDTPFRPDSRKF